MLNATLLSLFLVLLVPHCTSEKTIQYKQCRQICKDFLEDEFKKSNICQGAHNIKPKKASVHKACMKGKFMGYEHACMPTCMYDEYRGGEVEPGNSYEACKAFWKRPRPNNELPWCRRGYDYAYEVVKNDLVRPSNYLLVETGTTKKAEVEGNQMIQEEKASVDPSKSMHLEQTNATEEKRKSEKGESNIEAEIYDFHSMESMETVVSQQMELSSNEIIKEVVNKNTDMSSATEPSNDLIGETRDKGTILFGDKNHDEEFYVNPYNSFDPKKHSRNSADKAKTMFLSNFDGEIANPDEF